MRWKARLSKSTPCVKHESLWNYAEIDPRPALNNFPIDRWWRWGCNRNKERWGGLKSGEDDSVGRPSPTPPLLFLSSLRQYFDFFRFSLLYLLLFATLAQVFLLKGCFAFIFYEILNLFLILYLYQIDTLYIFKCTLLFLYVPWTGMWRKTRCSFSWAEQSRYVALWTTKTQHTHNMLLVKQTPTNSHIDTHMLPSEVPVKIGLKRRHNAPTAAAAWCFIISRLVSVMLRCDWQDNGVASYSKWGPFGLGNAPPYPHPHPNAPYVGGFVATGAHAASCQLAALTRWTHELTLDPFYPSVVELFCRASMTPGCNFSLQFTQAPPLNFTHTNNTTHLHCAPAPLLALLLFLLDCALHQINEQERHFITKLSLGVFISFSHWCNPSSLHCQVCVRLHARVCVCARARVRVCDCRPLRPRGCPE